MVDTLSVSSVVVAANEQVSTDLEGESVILGLESGRYYSLDDVGSFVWNLIQEPRPVSEIRDAILDAYDVESEVCQSDLLAILNQLADEGLIEF